MAGMTQIKRRARKSHNQGLTVFDQHHALVVEPHRLESYRLCKMAVENHVPSALTNDVGTTVIKHHDKWRGDYYLRHDLTFTADKNLAARFYLLKAGDTSIINGDRISINCGNTVLVVDRDNRMRLMDRDQIYHETRTFIVTDGTDNVTPVTHDTLLYILSDRQRTLALKYHWSMESTVLTPNSPIDQWPATAPNLVNEEMVAPDDPDIRLFTFAFEAVTDTVTVAPPSTQVCAEEPTDAVAKSKWWDWFESVRGPLFIVLLLVILVLIILTTQ